MKKIVPSSFVLVFLLIVIIVHSSSVLAWSNGGYSDDPSNPDYGTHDWIAEHALDWLPEEEKRYIVDNLAAYSYGTELPDNGIAPDGIGDTAKHHIYYWSNGSLQDDVAALRADEEYNNTLDFLELGDLTNASKVAGIMSHYIVDIAVFGHVMGSGNDWGTENHHSDYETYVNQRTDSYDDEFNTYLLFDGELTIVSACDAAIELAYDTTFDLDGDLTCVWMDQNYNWSDPVFKDRCGESLNLAVNYLTDVLHTLYLEVVPVHNIDSGKNFSTIQEAINDNETLDGHTIYVDAGTYYEQVVVNKSVSLVGEGRETTVIDGNMTGTVVYVKADSVHVANFTLRNSGTYLFWESGIRVEADHCNVTHNLMTNNSMGIHVYDCLDTIINENNITNGLIGIETIGSANTTITENKIAEHSWRGIWLLETSSTTVIANNITNNYQGVSLENSVNITMSGNIMEGNKHSFEVSGFGQSAFMHFMHSIDVSNLVNGKPVYYLVNQTDLTINSSTYPNVGYLALINCNNMVVESLALTKNGQGLVLAYTNNSRITGNNITDNYWSIHLYRSLNNTISGNNITDNALGTWISLSANISITGNTITNSPYGILVSQSSHNTIVNNSFVNCGLYITDSFENEIENNLVNSKPLVYLESVSDYVVEDAGQVILNNCTAIRVQNLDLSNTTVGVELLITNNTLIVGNKIANNTIGIHLLGSYNQIYHNNFIENEIHVLIAVAFPMYPYPVSNVWDNGFEGNYWSNYNGTDANQDGIGDTAYSIDENNADNYPLMGVFSDFQATLEHHVKTICNSTISDFLFEYFTPSEIRVISFNVMGEDGTTGFCRICIPRALMDEPYRVLVNATDVSYNILPSSNETHSYLYFTYSHSTQQVVIIPEFSTWTSMLLLLFILTVAIVFYKRRLLKTPIH